MRWTPLDAESRDAIRNAMVELGWGKKALAEELGMSSAWMTRLLQAEGGLERLREDHRLELMRILGVDLETVEERSNLSPLALRVAELVDSDEEFGRLAALLVRKWD